MHLADLWFLLIAVLWTGYFVLVLRAEATAATVELLQAVPDLICFGAAERRRHQLHQTDQRLTDALRATAATRGLGIGISTFAIGAATVGCTALGIQALTSGLPGPLLAVLALTPLATAELVTGLPDTAQRLLGAKRAAARLAELDQAAASRAEPSQPVPMPAMHSLAAHHLAVRWPGASADAVHDVDLTLSPGRRLALTGPSGAGKSTIVAALLRTLDPSAGAVLADGVNTLHCLGDEVRSRIGWCGPQAHLFA